MKTSVLTDKKKVLSQLKWWNFVLMKAAIKNITNFALHGNYYKKNQIQTDRRRNASRKILLFAQML